MTPIEPDLESAIGHDTLRVWMDFWELTGRLRVQIVRRVLSGGDPEKMIPPVVTETVIPAVPAILIRRDRDDFAARPGQIFKVNIRLELIDRIRKTDRLRLNSIEFEIDSILEKDMGDFSIWIVDAHRIK